MYFKLALRNVRKSYKDYFVYFMTLTFSVSLFYVFGSFEAQSTILELSQGQGAAVNALVTSMNVMSAIVSVVFAFLIIYANNFLIKRRKKELGLYTLMGMPKRRINFILIIETLLIGVASLGVGLGVGFIASQATSLMSASLLNVPMNYQFVFSQAATLKTVLSFGVIFLIVMLFNGRIFKKYTLIDLLRAERINEESNMNKSLRSILLFVSSLMLLLLAYFWALQPQHLILFMPIIIAMGSVATFYLFKSFSGFLLKFMGRNKKIYFKNLNLFVFRQVGAKINSSYRMMAVVSLLLLFGIATITTGFNLNSVMSEQLEMITPYAGSMSYTADGYDITFNADASISKLKKSDAKHIPLTLFKISDNAEIIESVYKDDIEKNSLPLASVFLADVKDYNALNQLQGKEDLQLYEREVYLYTKAPVNAQGMFEPLNVREDVDYTKALKVFDRSYQTKAPVEEGDPSLMTGGFMDAVIFMNTKDLNEILENKKDTAGILSVKQIVNLVSQDSGSVSADVEQISEAWRNMGISAANIDAYDAEGIMSGILGIELVFTYMGLYLGVVLLITAGAVLALQQLSEANDNIKRYQVLHKIGVDQTVMKHSVLKQISLYFGIPLGIALIHSYVGIRAVNVNLALAGLKTSSIVPTLLSVGGVLIVYALYFIATYRGSLSILGGSKSGK